MRWFHWKLQRSLKGIMDNQEIIKDERRTALVTGGSRGIGRAAALKLAEAGNNVVINYQGNEAAARETEELIHAACPDAGILIVRADVSREDEVREMVDSIMDAFGRIDILVNNAGITRDHLLLRMTAEDFDQVIATNLRGCFLLSKYAGQQMLKARYGRIINISSISGTHGNIGQVNYAASKAGILGITKSLAKEYASRGITVNAIAPGFIRTDMTDVLREDIRERILAEIPVKRLGEPSDVADAIVFLSRPESGFITGQVLGVDGGMGI
jgi:3-oxoacyl-[acyl-carrier protein] reductase